MVLKFRSLVYIILLYAIWILFLSWPLVVNLNGFLLPSFYQDLSHSDTLRLIGYINEMKKSGSIQGCIDCWDVPLTYVLPGVLFTSLGVDDIVYHNIFFLLCAILSGFFAYLLMLEISKHELASFFTGLFYMTSNFLFHEYYYGHTNILQIQWIPLVLLLVEKIYSSTKIYYPLFLGIALSLQGLSSSQMMIYLCFFIPAYIGLRAVFFDRKNILKIDFWLRILLACIISLAMSSYYLFKRLDYIHAVRSIGENMTMFWRLHSTKLLFDSSSPYFIGLIPLILIILGVIIICLNYDQDRYKKYVPFVALWFFMLIAMMGPFSKLAPYYWLYKFWPFVENLRTPGRLFPFFWISSSILASMLFISLAESKRLHKYNCKILVAVICLLIVLYVFSSQLLTGHHIFFP